MPMSDRASNPPPTARMTREEYFAWVDRQPSGRYERVEGSVVAMSPERIGHLERKSAVWLALRDAVRARGLQCQVFPDGATVSSGDNDFEPDAVVRCGERLASDQIVVPDPMIVVEVLSPATRHVDLTRKMAAYFQIPSVRHYLIFWADEKRAVHHRRGDTEGQIDTRIVGAGMIELDPPGLSIALDDIYPS